MINLFPDQEKLINETSAALKAGHKRVLMQAPTGAGKCLGKDTPVIMFDGSIKMAQDVIEGDILMGPDSSPRAVVSTCIGREEMYRVTPLRGGDSFVCNGSHILSLKRTNATISKSAKGYESRSKLKGHIENISVNDYLQKSKTFKHIYKLWRSPEINFKQKESSLPLDPYFLGVWLGDGTSRSVSVTTEDEVIKEYLRGFAIYNKLSVRTEGAGGNSETLHLVGERFKKNGLRSALIDLKVLNNKHIPHNYLTSSKESRLQILAGLLDTDGHLSKNCYDFVQKNKNIAQGVVFISRSLGLRAHIVPCKKSHDRGKTVGSYYRVSISGQTDIIPCKVKRKIASPRSQKKDPLLTGFTVKPLGVGTYYGFELSGPDRLFLLGDFTVTHNTIMAIHMISRMQAAGKSSWFVVPRKELLRQTSKSYDKFNVAHSYIAAGFDYDPSATCHIVSMQSLASRIEGVELPDIVFWDECNYGGGGMNSAWEYFREAGTRVVGKTATPKRGDGKGMGVWFDHLVIGPPMKELIKKGRLSEYKIFAPDIPDLSKVKVTAGDYNAGAIDEFWEKHGKVLFGNAAQTYLKNAKGQKGITFCQSVARSKEAAEIYNNHGIPAAHMDGSTPTEERKEIIEAFADGDLWQICSVDIMTFGFDLAAQVGRDVSIEVMTDLAATKSEAKQLQKWGRVLRAKDKPALIFDHVGNIVQHGLPCKKREWTLEGRKKETRAESENKEEMRSCPECYHCHEPAPHCLECGHVYEVKIPDVEVIDADLVEINTDLIQEKKKKRMEIGKAKTMADLYQIAEERGYKRGWVYHLAKAKGIKR